MSDSKQMFDDVILGLAKIFIEKNEQYGNSTFETGNTPEFKWWMRFSDVNRKCVRFEQLTHLASHGDVDAQKKLIDDYKDLAIYAIIAIIVLEVKDGV